MATASEARKWVEDLLADRVSLEDFEDWSASFSFDIHRSGDSEAQAIAYRIRSILNQHTEDLTDDALRLDLASAIGPVGANRYGAPGNSQEAISTVAVKAADRDRDDRS